MADTALNIRGIPSGVRESFKLSCITVSARFGRQVSMWGVLIECMRYLSNPDKLESFLAGGDSNER